MALSSTRYIMLAIAGTPHTFDVPASLYRPIFVRALGSAGPGSTVWLRVRCGCDGPSVPNGTP
jgi:hypothetical protein